MNIKVLSQKDLIQVLELPKVIEGVKAAYRAKAEGLVAAWPLVEHHFEKGAVTDIRSGGAFGEIGIHGAKLLNNFPCNADKDLPVFTGILMAFDSETGLPKGIMDASYITSLRTGAAAAIGASVLGKKDSETLLLVGAGRQSIYLLGSVLLEMPQLKKVFVADPLDPANAQNYVLKIEKRLKQELSIISKNVAFEPVSDLEAAAGKSDIIFTVTRSRKPLIMKDWIRPGTHISAIGADMVGKEEIDPEIFRTARAFADDIKQCCAVGEMEIPVASGILSAETICGEIGQVLTGSVPGRLSNQDITVFDATGLAALDLVTAKTAITLAEEKNVGTLVEI